MLKRLSVTDGAFIIEDIDSGAIEFEQPKTDVYLIVDAVSVRVVNRARGPSLKTIPTADCRNASGQVMTVADLKTFSRFSLLGG